MSEPVGSSVVRADGPDKVTGRAMYVADLRFPGMLYAVVSRSTQPRARILKVSSDRAAQHPGVVGVFTARDIPGANCVPVVIRDMPALAAGQTRYVGEPVAVVVGRTQADATAAAAMVNIEYESLDPVLDPLDAMKPGAPTVYGDDNVYAHHVIRRGDVTEGFGSSDVVLEEVYHTSYQEHAYLEPQGMIAVPAQRGGITVYGAMQCPFYVRDAVAEVLGLPLSKVRVVQMTTGGAFGGKEDVPSLVAAQAALPAHLLRRPVRLIYTREEDIESMSKRHPGRIEFKAGATRDGDLRAARVKYILDAGAYATLSPVVSWRGTIHSVGPYRCPNVKVDVYAVATNKVPCGAFRGFGSPQVLFAVESMMDELAAALGIDPATFRQCNILRKGDRTVTGQLLQESFDLEGALAKALEVSRWDRKRTTWGEQRERFRHGIGLSTVHYGAGLGAGGKHLARTGARVEVLADGSVLFAVGTTEMGQGMETVLGQIVAQELGLEPEAVHMAPVDTSRVPDSGPTVASRATMMSGNALRCACEKLRQVLLREGAKLLGTAQCTVKLGRGVVEGEHAQVSLQEVIRRCHAERLPLSTEGWHVAPPTSWDTSTGQGDAYVVFSAATTIAEVRVDTLTGRVEVLKVVAAHEIGKAVNPLGVRGQIEGGVVQGLGYALMEELAVEEGKILNTDLSTYLIPTAIDAPTVEALVLEDPYSKGPYGAKGFGEQPLMGVAPAVANAIYHATGVRLRRLPMTAEDVWRALSGGV